MNQQPGRVKQQNVHEIAAQDFPVILLNHIGIGLEGSKDQLNIREGAAEQNCLGDHCCGPAKKKADDCRFPKSSMSKSVEKGQKQECCQQNQQDCMGVVHTIYPKE